MTSPQYISNATIIGALPGTSPSNLNPGSSGVNFDQTNASVTIPFTPGTTPIIVQVSVPNTVTQFLLVPLPENSTITITFQTNDGNPPQNVTISVIACYTPSSATTIMTTGTVPPSVTGSTPTLTISSSTTVVTTGNPYRESYEHRY